MNLAFTNGIVRSYSLHDDVYLQSVLSDLCLRTSCHSCKIKNNQYKSDLTLADFWSVQNCIPAWNDDKGISLVISHSKAGENILYDISEQVKIQQVDAELALKENSSYFVSVRENVMREAFLSDLEKMNFDRAVMRYTGKTYSAKLRRGKYKLIKRLKDKVQWK